MERRKNHRIPFTIESVIRHNGREIEGKTLNISLRGLLINVSEELPVNSPVYVDLFVDGDQAKRKLSFSSLVVRSGFQGTAVKLMNLNLDLYITLKELMVNNSENSDKIMQEFCQFIENNNERVYP